MTPSLTPWMSSHYEAVQNRGQSRRSKRTRRWRSRGTAANRAGRRAKATARWAPDGAARTSCATRETGSVRWPPRAAHRFILYCTLSFRTTCWDKNVNKVIGKIMNKTNRLFENNWYNFDLSALKIDLLDRESALLLEFICHMSGTYLSDNGSVNNIWWEVFGNNISGE